jgi:D-threonate/D-erythronate kinase
VVAPGHPADAPEEIGAGAPADAFAVLGLPTVGADAGLDALAVWIPEVRSDDDLLQIAARSRDPATRRWLWCGSGGLAHALAATHGLAPAARDTSQPEATSGPVLLVSASHHPVVRQQWEVLRATERGAIMVTQGREAPLRAAFRAMGQSFDVAMFDLSPNRPLAPHDAATLLARQADAIARQAPRPGALVVVGGDTLRALCRAAEVRTLLAQAPPLPGWGRAQLLGGRWDGVPCYSRSGAFGDALDLTTMVRLFTGSRGTRKEAST